MPSPFPPAEPHGDLQLIFENAWFVTGSVPFKPLVRLVRNMVVLRHEGELTLVNAVRLNAEGELALDALGKVAHIMKIGGHGMDDAHYADRGAGGFFMTAAAILFCYFGNIDTNVTRTQTKGTAIWVIPITGRKGFTKRHDMACIGYVG